MSLLNVLGIGTAMAATTTHAAGQHAGGSFLSMLPLLIGFVAIFYFLMVRPQQKRAKEQKKLMGDLAVGDEVVTTAGIHGKLTKMHDNHVEVAVSDGVNVMLHKAAITNVLPKGTIDSLKKG